MLVNKCPFPPSHKRSVIYSVKGAGHKWQKVCFMQETKSPLVVVAKNENIPVMLSLVTGHKSRFHSYGIREAKWIISIGALLQFLWQEVTRSVATLLGWDATPLQVTPSNCQIALTNWPVPFTPLGGERY